MCIILCLSSFLFLWAQALYTMDEKPPEKQKPEKQFFFSAPPRSALTPRSTPTPRATPKKEKEVKEVIHHHKPQKRHVRSASTESGGVPLPHERDKRKQVIPPPQEQEPKPSFVPAKIPQQETEENPARHTFLSQEIRKRPTLFSLSAPKKKEPIQSALDQPQQKTSRSKGTQSAPFSITKITPTRRKSQKRLSIPMSPASHVSFQEAASQSTFHDQPPSKTSSRQKEMSDDYLLRAVQNGKTKRLKRFLDNEDNDPNQQSIGPKNTLLHLAVLYDKKNPNKDVYKYVSMLFLTNPRVNSLIKNNWNCAPYQCFGQEEMLRQKELYEALRLRATLDHIVNAILTIDLMVIAKNNNKETALKTLHDSKKPILEKLHDILKRIYMLIPEYANEQFVFLMMKSRIEYNFPLIAMLIRNREETDPNAQNEWGNTCLHDAVYVRNKHVLLTYLQNPMINSLIKNSEKLLAHQLIPTTEEKSSELRHLLFARNSLDTWIKEQLPQFLSMYPGNQIAQVDDLEFQLLIKTIKDTSENIKNAQKDKDEQRDDRELPEETLYPEYANDQFILGRFNAYKKSAKSEKLGELTRSNLDVFNEILVELDASFSHADK